MKRYLIIQLIFILCIASPIEQIKAHSAHNQYANNDDDLTPFGKKKKKKKEEKIANLVGKTPSQNKNDKPQNEEGTKRVNVTQPLSKPQDSKPDSVLAEKVKYDKPVYYAQVTRKDGWLVGVGKPLSQEQASHLGIYYKLSRKNKAGHWTLVETFNGYGNPTNPDFEFTYLWRDQIKDVCKWAFMSDATGETVYQERAMNADSTTVYVFSPTKIGEREYLGSYTDPLGLPMNLLKKESGSPSRVLISRDKRGFDILIKYIDDNGALQKNEEGAFMCRKEYDDEGNMTLSESLDMLGERMIDDCGNCGWKSVFRNGQCVETWYFDAEGLPMRMPMIKERAHNVYGFRYEYDQYGRLTATMHVDDKGNPDVDQHGVYMSRIVYNEHGKAIKQTYHDINGNLCNGYLDRIAQRNMQFDAKGRITLLEYRDKAGNYAIDEDDDCRQEVEYHKNGEVKRLTDYTLGKSAHSDIDKYIEYYSDVKGNTITKFHDVLDSIDIIKIDSVDALRRPILTAWYDLQGNPINRDEYHKETTAYADGDKHNTVTKLWVDKNGKPVKPSYLQNYSMSVVTTDSTNHIVREKRYDGELLVNSFEDVVDPKSGETILRNDLTAYGEAARVGWSNKLYYSIKRAINFNEKQNVHYGQNEFGEPSYISGLARRDVFFLYDDINDRYFDEDFNEIETSDMYRFILRLPRVYCIEVTDTAIAYPLGLRNGDIIISYGNWTASDDLKANMNNFYLETILQANVAKNTILLRHHPAEKSSEIVKIMLPPGKTSDLGFYPHMIYYTKKEIQRLKQTCEHYGVLLSKPVTRKDKATLWLAIQKKGAPDYTDFYYSPTINNRDPGIILYANADEEKWSFRKNCWTQPERNDETEAIIEEAEVITEDDEAADAVKESDDDASHFIHYVSDESPLLSMFTKRVLFITNDLKGLSSLNESYTNSENLDIIPVRADSSLLQQVMEFYTLHNGEIPNDYDIDDYRAMNDPAITSRKLIGKWNMTVQRTDNLTADFTLELDKSDQASCSILLTWNDPAGLKVRLNARPKWILFGICLELYFDGVSVTCEQEEVPGLTLSEDEQNLIDDYVERIKGRLEDFTLEEIFNTNYFVVKELGKKQMTVLDGDTERVFTKVK